MKALLAAALLLLPLPALALELTPNRMQDWSGAEGDKQVFTLGDVTLTLVLAGDEAERLATLTVERPGLAPVALSGMGAGAGFGQLGLLDFDADGTRSAVLAVYAGGAHCCMQTWVATETAGGWVTAEIGSFDGDVINPEDVDGDGRYEIVQRDDRFNYTFDAYALSYPPPLVLKSRGGEVYDASAEPAFRPLFAAMLDDARPGCSGATYELGVCAGFLAAAARLGTYAAEAPPVFAAIAAGAKSSGWDEFTLCVDAACAETTEIADFREALETALAAWGYLPG